MIRPTFLGFETAKRSLMISQLGLDTIGHNIGNASTPGYTRQRVDQVSIASSGYAQKYQVFGVQFPGQGADVNGINQIRDPYLDKRYRTAATNYGELSVKNNGLVDINNIMDEISSDGLHAKVGDLLGKLELFLQQSDSPDMAAVVRSTAKELVSILNKNSNDLDIARDQQKFDLGIAIADDVNNVIKMIADLNVKIKEDNFYGNPSNELNDSRNLLLDQLSEYLDIKVVRTPVRISSDLVIERVSVELNDSGNPPIVLLDSGKFNKLKVNEDPDNGNVSIELTDGLSDYTVIPDITNKLLKGGIKGYVDVINGEGPLSGGNTFRGVPYYKASLNDFAAEFARIMNTVNSISAAEAAASGNPPMIEEAVKNLFANVVDPSQPITAATIGVSKEWLDDPLFITSSKRNPVTKIQLTSLTMPKHIDSIEPGDVEFPDGPIVYTYSAGPPATLGALIDGVTYTGEYKASGKVQLKDSAGNIGLVVSTNKNAPQEGTYTSVVKSELVTAAANDNVLKFIEAFSASNTYANSLKGSFQEYLVGLQASDAALDLAENEALLKSSGGVIGQLADRRDSISAVNADEEAISMMTYQNYYNAAARYMTVLDEALDKIINGMGIVGR